jgi:phage I-like protein
VPPKLPTSANPVALAATFVDLFGRPTAGADRVPPSEFKIFPMGVVSSLKGEFLFDATAAGMVMAAALDHAVDFTIDYDHHTLHVKNGVKAVAAGWFNLELRNDGLYAINVSWTPDADEHLRKGEYRYFSPLFNWDETSGRITSLINNALTNTPALDGQEALVAASASANTNTQEDTVDPELKKALDRAAELERQLAAQAAQIRTLEGNSQIAALSATVGLAANAGADEVRTRVVALTAFRKDVLAIAGKDSDHMAVAALTAMKEQAGEVVALRTQVQEAQTAALSAQFGSYLDGLATKGADGKHLPPAKRKKAEAMALSIGGGHLTAKGIEAAKEYIAEMMVVAPGDGEGDKSKGATIALSAMQIEIAKATGTSLELLQKHAEKRLAQAAGA